MRRTAREGAGPMAATKLPCRGGDSPGSTKKARAVVTLPASPNAMHETIA